MQKTHKHIGKKPIKKSARQKALESLLNDDVVQKATGLFLWRGRYLEVLPYSLTLKRHNWSGFIKLPDSNYMLREASDEILKKYYPEIEYLTNN